jgi:Ca-activated chloride channel family protein
MTIVETILSLSWREPLYFWLVLFPIFLIILRSLCARNRLDSYADRDLQRWVVITDKKFISHTIFSRTTAYIIAWTLLISAAAGPRMPANIPGQEKAVTHDIFLVVDISRSMRAVDIEPDRLRRVRIELHELLARTSNSRVGIIVYTASSHILAPLSYDMKLISSYLDLLDKVPAPTYGSNPIDALLLANRELGTTDTPSSIIWVTDGDLDADYQDKLESIAVDLKSINTPLYILDAGSVEGDAIPLDDGSWLSDAGQAVVSRSNVELLMALAAKSGGDYSPIFDDDSDWQTICDKGINSHVSSAAGSEQQDQTIWIEYYPHLLLPGIIFLIIAWIPYPVPARLLLASPRSIATILAVISISVITNVIADEDMLYDAHTALTQHKFVDAEKFYEQVQGFDGRFGQGASSYRQGDYPAAINQFTQAVLQADDDKQRAISLYNLGNAYFKTGNYKSAIQVYRDSLQYSPDFAATASNLALSEKLQKAVEVQLQQRKAKAARMGRGTRSQRVEENITINNSALASLDDTVGTESTDTPVSELYTKLLEKGIEYADLATTDTDKSDTYSRQQTILESQLAMQSLENRRELLWKRIFEIEYGFAAPMDKPANVSGVKPW